VGSDLFIRDRICGAAVLALRTWESNELRSRG
jgi:hypothetical protein